MKTVEEYKSLQSTAETLSIFSGISFAIGSGLAGLFSLIALGAKGKEKLDLLTFRNEMLHPLGVLLLAAMGGLFANYWCGKKIEQIKNNQENNMNKVFYNPEQDLFSRFMDHAALGLSKEIQDHEENIAEKVGNAILWTAQELPDVVWKKIQEPRVVAVALTNLALLTNSFLFYPAKTLATLKNVITWLPLPPLWTLRAGTYLYTCSLILGYGLRSFGRFSNQELMAQFYQDRAPVQQQ
jgi:hypothetical protein